MRVPPAGRVGDHTFPLHATEIPIERSRIPHGRRRRHGLCHDTRVRAFDVIVRRGAHGGQYGRDGTVIAATAPLRVCGDSYRVEDRRTRKKGKGGKVVGKGFLEKGVERIGYKEGVPNHKENPPIFLFKGTYLFW